MGASAVATSRCDFNGESARSSWVSKRPPLRSSRRRRYARFSESGGSQSLQVGTGTSKPRQSGAPPKLPCESSGSSMSIPEPACKGTLSDPQVISESELSPESKKSRKKTKGKKKTKSDQCRNRRWQDSWAASFPWAEKHREEGQVVVAVKCLVCTKIEGRLRKLCCKRDNLNKHANWCKADKDLPQMGVKKGEYWRDKNSRHYKNEKLFAALNKATVLEQLNLPVDMNWSKKKCQFVVILNMLLIGRPMIDYPSYRDILSFLDCPLIPFKHWSVSTGWGIAECLQSVVQNRVKAALAKCDFFSLTCNEVTTVDCQTWISIHVYVVKDFVHVPMLLTLERVIGGVGSDNLTTVLVEALQQLGGLTLEQIRDKLLCFGADGAAVFHGVRGGVTVQLQREFSPFLLAVHCSNHKTNLAMHVVSKTAIVSKGESLLSALHTYFSKSPKKCLEFSKLVEIMETKGLKILKHCKTRWVGMLAPLKRVLSEWRLLIVKMALDSPRHPPSRALYDLLADVDSLLAMAYMFEAVQSLNKFGQSHDVALCNFVTTVKQCEILVGLLYVSPETRYSGDEFSLFSSIASVTSQSILMKWMPDLSSDELVEHLCFESNKVSRIMFATVTDKYREQQYVTPVLLACAVNKAKTQCTGPSSSLLRSHDL